MIIRSRDWRTLIPEGVTDILRRRCLEGSDITPLSYEYLVKVRDIEHRNLAVQLLLKLLRGITHPARQLPNIESLAACNAVAIIFFCAQGR